jgi:hypothetical protein
MSLKIATLRQAEVLEIKKGHSRRTQDKRLYINIKLDNGVRYNNVPFYGPGVDLETEMPHGSFFPPVKNQKVGVFFVQGHPENPYGAFPIPYPVNPGKDAEKYYNILEDIEDGGVFHKSGSRSIHKKNGDIITTTGEVQSGALKKKTVVTQKATGEIINEVYDGNNQLVSKTRQSSDGDVEIENYDGGTKKGFCKLAKTTGFWDFNGHVTFKI